MGKPNRLLQGALLLTLVNLLLRFAGTSFQVWLAGRIGAAGIGLLQLILSVNMLCWTLGAAGGRTTAMYLTAGELGRGNPGNADRYLSGCFVYSICCSGTVSVVLFALAPRLAEEWIGTPDALPSLRTWAAFLPVICLSGVMTGYFTAANRIGTLAAVEVGEQLLVMAVTVAMLLPNPNRAGSCRAVVLGTCLGSVVTLLCLMALYTRMPRGPDAKIRVAKEILHCAVPLALADDLKAGISALENLMVPRRLALFAGLSDPLAAFGRITGMVFPVMMFPSAILSSLAEVLIPELARCNAVGSRNRIRYLIRRNLRVTLLYGLLCGGILWLLAEPLTDALYPGESIAPLLRRFSILVPMLYCDLIVDAMTKGLGEQRACVRYNILSNSLDVTLLFLLLPRYGLDGYFFSFTVTHVLNFALSLRRLFKIGQVRAGWYFALLTPAAALFSAFGAAHFDGPLRRIAAFLGLFLGLCFYTGILGKGDVRWLKGLVRPSGKESQ